MGVIIPQVITEDRASGAQVVDGSLRTDHNKAQYLSKTVTEGNRSTHTFSFWTKLQNNDQRPFFGARNPNASSHGLLCRTNSGKIQFGSYNSSAWTWQLLTSEVYRDFSGWYHIVFALDTTQATAADRVKIYINGRQVTAFDTASYPSQNYQESYGFTNNTTAYISAQNWEGSVNSTSSLYWSNFYFIDGQQLGPEYFGYTDPLTNTWRPKKFIKQASPNDGTTWSSYLTADSGSITNAANAFNNDVLSFNTSTVNEAVFTFTPPTPIQYKNSVRIWLRTALHKARINGGTYIFNTGAQVVGQWMTLATGSGSIQSIDVQYTGGSQTAINAIEVDGVILVDGLNDNAGVGTNGFYLPMDGNSPVGQDQSGRGNDWQPINFGGSVELPKTTGAFPILNTNEAGTIAKNGVRTDKKTYTVTASGSSYYLLDGVQQPTLSALRGGSYTFDYTGATSHPFYLSSLQDGKHNSEAYSVTFDGEDSWIDIANGVTIGTSTFTWECFFYVDNFKDYITIFDTRESSNSDVNGIYVGARNDGLVYVWSNGYRIQTNRVSTGEWHHIALVRDSNNLMHLYIDGTHAYNTSGAWTYSNSVNALTRIGQTQYSSFVTGSDFEWEGKLSNVRITVGQALYTSNFTPPTTTLTTTSQGAIASNVKLLCCQSSSATTAAVSPGTLTTSGNAAAVNVSPFLYDNNHGYFGVNTATSNTTKITIPHWAPDTLYYYCNVHSGMGGRIDVTTDNLRADPYAWMCKLALPLTGKDNRDLSSDINVNATAMTVAPTASVIGSTAKYNFYGSSTYYGDHTNAYRHEISANNGLSFGDVPWTIECWCYRDSATVSNSYQTLWSFRTNGTADYHQAGWISFLINASSSLLWYYGTGSGNTQFGPTETIGLNRWTHIASVWDGKGNIELYFDGIKVHTQAISKTDWGSSTLPFYIADQAYNGGTRALSGYMQDFRVYKGVAKYSENFLPASTNPDILPDTPSGVAGGSALTKITDGAVGFGGSADYLSLADSTDFNLSTNDFTFQFWVYYTSNANIYSRYDYVTNNRELYCSVLTDGTLQFRVSHDGTSYNDHTAPAGSLRTNAWNYVVITRVVDGSNSIYRSWVDGNLVKKTTIAQTTVHYNSQTTYIGDYLPGTLNNSLNGFLSNFRLINGTALYTTDDPITVPTAPLTNVTNTKLLCCQSQTSASFVAASPGTFVNDGTNYSSNNQVTGSAGLTDVDSIFNGWLRESGVSVGGQGANVTYSADNYILWTPTTGIPYSSKVEVFCYAPNGYNITNYYTFNGGAETSFVGGAADFNGNAWITVATGSGTINSIKIRLTRSSGTSNVNWYAVRVDGTVLINNYSGKAIARVGETAATNFNPFITDSINAVRGQETGYCTLNPLDNNGGALSDGNLFVTSASTSNVSGTLGVSSGKWYWECVITGSASGGVIGVGAGSAMAGTGLANLSKIYGWSPNGSKYQNTTQLNYTGTYGVGDIIGVSFDADTRELTFYQNGVAQGVAFTVDSGYEYKPQMHLNGMNVACNFGQKPFKFPPPDGFQPLNASNVRPSTVIARPDKYFDVVTYTGTSAGTQTVSGLNFQPDLVWLKHRESGASGHIWTDSVRGAGVAIFSNATNLQDTNAAAGYLSSFNSNGFTLSDGSSNGNRVKNNGSNYVAWCWKAGGSAGTFNVDDVDVGSAAAAGLSGKNITPTACSIGTKQGFSIIQYTGNGSNNQTVPHGLSQAPAFILTKSLNETGSPTVAWGVFHKDGSYNNAMLYLMLTAGQSPDTNVYTTTSQTDEHFTIGTWPGINQNTTNYISYIWHDVPGLQKFGSFEGNGDANGTFVELGFRPSMIIIRGIDNASRNWLIDDATRNPYNGKVNTSTFSTNYATLAANLGSAEPQSGAATFEGNYIDFLSNGFKLRSSAGNSNGSETYIYAAWAEAPSFNLYGAQANAR